MTITADDAIAIAETGYAVVPPREDGSKRPDGTWQQYEHTAPDRATIERWYNGGRDGIGVICGAASGHLEMLELEGRAVDDGILDQLYQRATDTGIGELLYRISDAYMERSPSGGVHLLYRVDGGALGNVKLARRPDEGGTVEVLIETRGQGGYTVLAPTSGKVHPTGDPWTVLCGSLADVVTITATERDQLHDLCRTFDQLPTRTTEPPAERPYTAPSEASGTGWMDSVVAAYNDATTWEQVLGEHGWQLHHHGGPVTYWTRPGKDPRLGHSASTNAKGTDRFIAFSSSVHHLIEPYDGTGMATSYDRFSIHAILAHDGDRPAAAHALNTAGHGRPLTGDIDPSALGLTSIGPAAPSGSGGRPGGPLNLPADFWAARPVLAHIRQAAHHRARSADAVLGVVLARVAAFVPPNVDLPAIVGAAGSLNTAIAIIGRSGGGKSTAKRLAVELVPHINDRVVDDLPLGSGEGLIEAYFEYVDETDDNGKKVRVKRQTKEGLFAYLDEGQALGAMGSRQGSTLLPTLRSAWSGDTLGQANASEERRRQLASGTYRFSVVIGFQPEHATKLLNDVDGGTPQRFVWLSADDPTAPDDPPPWPGPIDWAPPPLRALNGVPFPQTLGVPGHIAAGIRRTALLRTRGQIVVNPLDAHHELSQLKLAGLFAVIDQRDDITDEDWELAATVMATSRTVRDSVADRARAAAEARERAENTKAVRKQSALIAGEVETAQQRIVKVIAKHVHRHARKTGEACRGRCILQAIASRDRHIVPLEEAIESAVAEGWITVDGDLIRPGKGAPA